MSAATPASSSSLETPVIVIQPPKGWMAIDFPEMWRFRELLYFFTWRDIKVRFKQTLLGFAWAIIGPVASTIVFTVIFGNLAGLATDGLPKPVFYGVGIVIWNYFSRSLTACSMSLVGSAHLLTKIYFPRLLVPASACITELVDFAIAFAVLIGLMLMLGILPAAASVLLPLLVLMALLTALGMGLLFAALNVRYRDVKILVPFILQFWQYATIIVPFSEVMNRFGARFGAWTYVYTLNPMVGVVEGFRWCLLNHRMTSAAVVETKTLDPGVIPEVVGKGQNLITTVLADGRTQATLQTIVETPAAAPLAPILVGLPVAIVMFLVGLWYFKRVESKFADIV